MVTRRGGLSSRRDTRRATAQGGHEPWSLFRNPLPPVEMIDDSGLERIEAVAFRVLEELGLEFQNARALDILKKNGADVDRGTQIVRFDRALIRAFVRKAPREFAMHARNPARNLVIGGNSIVFVPVGGPPNVSDLDRGRRPGSSADLRELIKLHHALDVVHMTGGTLVEPLDLPAETRHLDLAYLHLTMSDRVWGARAIGRERMEDAVRMAAIARGMDLEQLGREPSLFTVINVNSPRRVDSELLAGLMELAKHGQVAIITPFTLAGAMSPITIAGALAQQTAEALAVIAFTQMVRPGAPVVFGGFTSNVDMKSGAPAFGTPEYVRAVIIGGQIARRWGLPYRSSNVTASNAVDAQAVMESMMSLWAAILAHANVIMHATGWLESGLTTSYEKIILDADMIGAMRAWLSPLDLSDDALAFETIAATPPGGHFFGTAHTLARFETAFHASMVSDLRPFGTWEADGARTATERAHTRWKALLETYQEPPMDPAMREALDAFVAERKAVIGRRGLAA